MPAPTSRQRPQHCLWCGREMAPNPRGRFRKYCSHSCRQRAYEQRAQLKGTSIPADAVILSAATAEELFDQLFELRCAAEDVRTAVADGESGDSVAALTDELVAVARRVEKLRGQQEPNEGGASANPT